MARSPATPSLSSLAKNAVDGEESAPIKEVSTGAVVTPCEIVHGPANQEGTSGVDLFFAAFRPPEQDIPQDFASCWECLVAD